MPDYQELFSDPKTGEKCPAVWTDKEGVTHRAVGEQMIPHDRDTFIMWTACGKKDVPANGSWMQRPKDKVTCAECGA